MLTKELINKNLPRLHLQDAVGKALQLTSDFRMTHLPVVADERFMGLISEEDLLDADDKKLPLEALQKHFINAAVKDNVHFLNAVNVSNQLEANIVAVISEENKYEGAISATELLKAIGNYSGANEQGGIIVLEMERSQFAISEISRLVESNDCTILHLNTTVHPETGMLTVSIHINKKEVAAVVSTFERYDYDVIYYFGIENFENEIHSNYKHLMNYLDI